MYTSILRAKTQNSHPLVHNHVGMAGVGPQLEPDTQFKSPTWWQEPNQLPS